MKFRTPKPWKYYTFNFTLMTTFVTCVLYFGWNLLVLGLASAFSFIVWDFSVMVELPLWNLDSQLFTLRLVISLSAFTGVCYILDTKTHNDHVQKYMETGEMQ